MFRTTCLSIALGLALVASGAMAFPASAQGTVRGHGAPPAPKPTVDRDQRRGVRETDAVQWEIRDSAVKTCQRYMLANARRAGSNQPSMLTPKDAGMTWSGDGGNWGFDIIRVVDGTNKIICGKLTPNVKDKMGLWSTKKHSWLDSGLKWTGSIAQVWTVKGITTVAREGVTYQRFAIFNEVDLRYLMLCHDETDKAKNDQALCLYDAVIPPG